MARDSMSVRKLRRLKRERTIALKLLDIVGKQRDEARMVAMGLEQELKKHLPAPEAVPQPVEGVNPE